jgi:hypothetical protein
MVTKAKPDSRQIHVVLPRAMRALFNQLVARKLYGDDNSAVARQLMIAGLERLVEQRSLVDNPFAAIGPDDLEAKTEPEAGNEEAE